MPIRFHRHAVERMEERNATALDVEETIQHGERFEARFGRTGFRRNFCFDGERHGRYYQTKEVEVYAVEEDFGWLVLTVITRYF